MYSETGNTDVAEIVALLTDAGKLPMTWANSGYETTPLAGDVYETVRDMLANHLPGEWVRATLIGMPSRIGFIHLHTDERREDTRRFHVVLTTNRHSFVYHDGRVQHLPQGHIFSIDETVEHASVNWGDTDRVHLVIDIRKNG